jgi:transcription antitermination factor NusA-like protein
MIEAVEAQITVPVRDKSERSAAALSDCDEEIQEAIAIPDEAVGTIIGNKGSNIRALQMKTETEINIVPMIKRDKKVYMALIRGTRRGRTSVKEQIMAIVRSLEKADTSKRPAGIDARPSKFSK